MKIEEVRQFLIAHDWCFVEHLYGQFTIYVNPGCVCRYNMKTDKWIYVEFGENTLEGSGLESLENIIL